MHRRAIEDPSRIRALLERLRDDRIQLAGGVNQASTPRTAYVRGLAANGVLLDAKGIECTGQPQIYLSFDLLEVPYFFAVPPVRGGGDEPLLVAIPSAIYEAERRDLQRAGREVGRSQARRVELRSRGHSQPAVVADSSYQGLGVVLPAAGADRLERDLEVRFLDGERRGEEAFATLKHRAAEPGRPGWVRLGLSVSRVPENGLIPLEERDSILLGETPKRAWRRHSTDRVDSRACSVEVIEYSNGSSGNLCGIVDRTGDARGAPVVVIPPAWGRTKETQLALAQTLVQTFEQAGESLVVVRFDGTDRRGESYIAPENRSPGREYLAFTFSQAVQDIRATLDFFESSPDFQSRRFILVTYSLGSIEGRRATALDSRIRGWVSVVGMADLQSGLRTVSGGIDYAYGATQGVEFGAHELVGVVADMDLTGRDALEENLVFAEDARRDMANIKVPTTWIHGQYDAWMDLARVRALLSAGDTSRRLLIQIPAGHRIRSSREAFQTFQLVTEQVAAMCIGRPLRASQLDLDRLESAGQAETARLPDENVDLREFWKDYLLGRDRQLGIELMTSTSAYRSLMYAQIGLLELRTGELLVDLGAGTGDCPLVIAARPESPGNLTIVEIDFVNDALARGRRRMQNLGSNERAPRLLHVCADLGRSDAARIPLLAGVADAVIASLLISYLPNVEDLLSEVIELLRPGGRLVLSSLRRDADISRIYVDGISELPPDRVREHFGETAVEDFDRLQRQFLNDAARLIDFEEAGHFRFWDADELEGAVAKAGFVDVCSKAVFGEPPQAVVVGARRP